MTEALIPMKVFGVHLATDGTRPILILKDEASGTTVPVVVSSVDAAISIAQSNPATGVGTPHRFAMELLNSLRVKVLRAMFLDVKNGVQLLTFELEGHPHLSSLKVRADECMSFCLHLQVPMFASAEFVRESKVMIHEQQTHAHLYGAQFNTLARTHEYLN